MRVVDRIRVPALIITAEDDPFVPVDVFRHPSVTGNRFITLEISAHGGHCGFVGPRAGEDDGYWAEDRIVQFATGSMGAAHTADTASPVLVSTAG
jgi:predicted alpha/beta-fold hydrolase